MKFIIYGAGYRGERLFHYLGLKRVKAFIDSAPAKQVHEFCNLPVIGMEQYENCHLIFPIIISPSNATSIRRILDNKKILHYSVLSELPSEFEGYGSVCFDDCYKPIIIKYSQPCYLYGMNAFSLLLFHELKKLGNDVYFLQREDRMSQWIETCLPNSILASPLERGNLFLCCHTSVEDIANQYTDQIVIGAFDYSSNLPIYYNKKIETLKNAFSDRRRCFIIATGGSLRNNDLEQLKDNGEFCFGVNKIFKMGSAWRPNVYVVTDSFLLQEAQEDIAKYDVPLKFFGDGNYCKEAEKPNEYVIHVVGGQYLSAPPPFSENIAQKVYGGGTVTYACIQIAVYLGFKEIYLLGVDCDYTVGSVSNHFYAEDKPDMTERSMAEMTLAFQAAHQYADAHGIKICNATRGGNLEIFERVDFDSLF